jgi:NAD(P)-dependent dehydrogenase (short-subunit alcohol dehydrogenase family)
MDNPVPPGITPEGRVVAITGAGSGIGEALALQAAALGAAAVAIIDINIDSATAVATRIRESGVRAAPFVCDVSDTQDITHTAAHVAEKLGNPEIVFANAGVNPPHAGLLDIDEHNLSWALSVNLIGVWATLRAFGRLMATDVARGWLAVTASEHAVGVPFSGNSAYTASKHAVLGLCDAARGELPAHIGSSVLIPGLVSSGLWNSGQLRPDHLGGPLEPISHGQEMMAMGMPADKVARRAFDGIAEGRFIIATHPHVERYALARQTEIQSSFAALHESANDDEDYDISTLTKRRRQARADRTNGGANSTSPHVKMIVSMGTHISRRTIELRLKCLAGGPGPQLPRTSTFLWVTSLSITPPARIARHPVHPRTRIREVESRTEPRPAPVSTPTRVERSSVKRVELHGAVP